MSFPLYDVVCSLLVKPFLLWNEVDQIEVIACGRPQVSLFKAESSDSRTNLFRRELFHKYDWLCASVYYRKLYCWPCLLFGKIMNQFFTDEFTDVHATVFTLHEMDNYHEVASNLFRDFKQCKVDSVIKKKLFKSDYKDESQDGATTKEERTRRLNQECVMYTIDAISYMIQNQMPFWESDIGNVGKHSVLVNLMMSRSTDDELKKHFRVINQNPMLLSTIHQPIIESMSESIEEYIKEKVLEAEFFVIRIDDGIDESTDCSIFLRCLQHSSSKAVELKEYFIGSYNLGTLKNSVSLFRILASVLDSYHFKDKLIGISYDITCVKFGYLKDLRVGLKFVAPYAIHVNLLGHHIDYLLERCLCSIPNCRMFFAHISTLLTLLPDLAKKFHFINSNNIRVLSVGPNNCCSKYELISALLTDWCGMKCDLELILKESTLPDEQYCHISNLLSKMQDYEFVFLAVFFRYLFRQTTGVYETLKSYPLNATCCRTIVRDFSALIYSKRNEGFYCSISIAANKILNQSQSDSTSGDIENIDSSDALQTRMCSTAMRIVNQVRQRNLKPLLFEIMDNVIMEMHTRFEDVDRYSFFNLADSGFFEYQVTTGDYGEDQIENLMQFFPDFFKEPLLLQNELRRIKKNFLFWKLPILRILRLMNEFPEHFSAEVYKLFSMVVLLTTFNVGNPCLHKYASFLKKSNVHQRLHLSRIAINQSVLDVLNSNQSGREKILHKLSKRYQGIKLKEMTDEDFKDEEAQQSEVIPSALFPSYAEMNPNLFVTPDSNMVVELDPKVFHLTEDTSFHNPVELSQPGPSRLMEPDSSMVDESPQLEILPVVPGPDSGFTNIKIKEEPVDSDILSANVERELIHLSKDTPAPSSQQQSLLQPPVYIKEEPMSLEDEL